MSKIRQDYSNYNKVSVKTDSMVKMIDQLAKLGVFKEKRKPRGPRKPKAEDMGPGYVRPVEGGSFGLRTPPSQNQLEDLQRRNEATIARLSGEIQQQRLADIEAQQGQQFADITGVGDITNPVLGRFRSAQKPGAGVYDPFMPPDVQEERFTQTLNEGGPEADEESQGEEIFADEEDDIPMATAFVINPRMQPVEKIDVSVDAPGPSLLKPRKPISRGPSSINKKRQDKADDLGLGPIPDRDFPPNNKEEIRKYYELLMTALGREVDRSITDNKKNMHTAILSILAE